MTKQRNVKTKNPIQSEAHRLYQFKIDRKSKNMSLIGRMMSLESNTEIK